MLCEPHISRASELRGATVAGEADGEVRYRGSVGLTVYSRLVLSFSACLGTPKRVLIAPGVQLDGQLQRLCERARIHGGVCIIVTLSRQVLMAWITAMDIMVNALLDGSSTFDNPM